MSRNTALLLAVKSDFFLFIFYSERGSAASRAALYSRLTLVMQLTACAEATSRGRRRKKRAHNLKTLVSCKNNIKGKRKMNKTKKKREGSPIHLRPSLEHQKYQTLFQNLGCTKTHSSQSEAFLLQAVAGGLRLIKGE